jgi:hypothetical protein
MYRIIGADGKEYGPVTIQQLEEWFAQRRISGQTRIQAADSGEWRLACEVPEVACLIAARAPATVSGGVPPLLSLPVSPKPKKGLAIVSFVLGLSSFVLCLNALTGIPAILCGHIARRRALRVPVQYGGSGFAMAGLLLGYLSILSSLVFLAALLPELAKHRPRTERTDCQNNLRQLGLALKVWALDHNDQYPFNVSTNSGGSLELCARGDDGFDNSLVHFLIISNELNTPRLLVCPNDPAKHVAADFSTLQSVNVSYRLRTGAQINAENPQEVLAVCPIHGNQLFCDGNVRKNPPARH